MGVMPLCLNLMIDPYGLFSQTQRSGKLAQYIERAHYPLWKLAAYEKNRNDIFILGDSRARALQEKYWKEYGRNRVTNLAYGGGTIPEIYSTFQIIKQDPGLQTLVVGIQLRSFDEDHKGGMNRVPEAERLVQRPLEYLKNWSVAKTSLHVLRSEYAFLNSARASMRVLPKKFATQVERNGRADWQDFEFSRKYWSMLVEIAEWAKANNKKLIFVIPPTIAEMRQTIVTVGLAKQSEQLRASLSNLGLVLDFDMPGKLTNRLENFNDAYHFAPKVGRMIVGQILRAIGSEQTVLESVKKRESSIKCPLSDASKGMVTGQNCRVVFANANFKPKLDLIAVPQSCAIHKAHQKRRDRLLSIAKIKDAKAAFELARIYKNTKGADCQQRAFKWFLVAGNGGNPEAYAELGNAYKKGRGVSADYKKAVTYFYKSAKYHYVSSAFSLINLVEKGTGDKAPNLKQAKLYLDEFLPLIEEGINNGNAVAARSLARLYYRSRLVEQDVNRAISLYKRASNAGDKIAKHDLALILLRYDTSPRSQEYALTLLREGIELKYPASFTALGRLHLKPELGLGREEAIVWFERGADHGHGGAFQELAKLYLEGKLVKQDYARAFQYALEGQKLGHQGSRLLLSQMRKQGIINLKDKS